MNFGISFVLSLVFIAIAIVLMVAGAKSGNRLFYYCAAFAALANLIMLGYSLLTVMLVG